MWPQAKESAEPPEAGRGRKDPPLELSEGAVPCDPGIDLDSRTVRTRTCIVSSHHVCGTWLCSPRTLIRGPSNLLQAIQRCGRAAVTASLGFLTREFFIGVTARCDQVPWTWVLMHLYTFLPSFPGPSLSQVHKRHLINAHQRALSLLTP